MKKSAALFLVCALLLTLSASSFSLGLGTMSSTFTLGPFSIETNMPVMSRTDTKAETIGENYGLVSIAGFVTDDLVARISKDKLDEASIQYMAAQLKKDSINAAIYRNSHNLYGLYYIQNIGSSRVLSIMMVRGQDCLLITTTLHEEEEFNSLDFTDYYAKSLMDSVSLK